MLPELQDILSVTPPQNPLKILADLVDLLIQKASSRLVGQVLQRSVGGQEVDSLLQDKADADSFERKDHMMEQISNQICFLSHWRPRL